LTIEDHNRFFHPQRFAIDDVLQQSIAKEAGYYQTTAIADHAIECLHDHALNHAEQPFFHYVAFTCPHFPLQAPAADTPVVLPPCSAIC
jgi:arylsulfatase